jgi:hypothetical protein
MNVFTLISRSLVPVAALAGLLAGPASHAEVVWSVGVHEPGVHVRVGNVPPPPVVVPVVVRPVVVQAPPVIHGHVPRGRAHGYWRSRHGHHHWR